MPKERRIEVVTTTEFVRKLTTVGSATTSNEKLRIVVNGFVAGLNAPEFTVAGWAQILIERMPF